MYRDMKYRKARMIASHARVLMHEQC